MEEVMAHALRIFRANVLPDAVLRFVDTTLRWEFDVRPRKQDKNRYPTGPLDAATTRDIGARREYQDYSSSAGVPAAATQHLHRIADAVRWRLPR
jgi:hypothetical protein